MFEAHSQYPDQSELHSEFLAEPSHSSRVVQSTRHQCSLYQWWTCGKITLPLRGNNDHLLACGVKLRVACVHGPMKLRRQ